MFHTNEIDFTKEGRFGKCIAKLAFCCCDEYQ